MDKLTIYCNETPMAGIVGRVPKGDPGTMGMGARLTVGGVYVGINLHVAKLAYIDTEISAYAWGAYTPLVNMVSLTLKLCRGSKEYVYG